MTVYIYTPEQHARLVDALDTAVMFDADRDDGYYAAALAMLKAMQPVEPINDDLTIAYMTGHAKAKSDANKKNQMLLEALKEMLYWFPCNTDRTNHIAVKARTAIAQAEGATP